MWGGGGGGPPFRLRHLLLVETFPPTTSSSPTTCWKVEYIYIKQQEEKELAKHWMTGSPLSKGMTNIATTKIKNKRILFLADISTCLLFLSLFQMTWHNSSCCYQLFQYCCYYFSLFQSISIILKDLFQIPNIFWYNFLTFLK